MDICQDPKCASGCVGKKSKIECHVQVFEHLGEIKYHSSYDISIYCILTTFLQSFEHSCTGFQAIIFFVNSQKNTRLSR